MDAEDSVVAMVSRRIISTWSSFKHKQQRALNKSDFSWLSLDDFSEIDASSEDFLHPDKD